MAPKKQTSPNPRIRGVISEDGDDNDESEQEVQRTIKVSTVLQSQVIDQNRQSIEIKDNEEEKKEEGRSDW